MTYLLWQLLRDAYAELGQLQVSEATGGSTTTIVDSKLIGTGRDDDWNGGAVIVLSAGGAAPEGELGRVSDYVDTTGTLTVPEMSAAMESGDLYGLVSEYYPLQQVIELANQALRNLGDLTYVDTAALDTAAGQTEYAASAAWKRRPPRRIDIQTCTGNAGDHRWALVRDWAYVPAAAGETGLIVFRTQLPAGRELRIWYADAHKRVSAYDDVIHESIHPALAVAAVVEKALVWQVSRLDGENEFLLRRLENARAELERQKRLHPVWQAGRVSRGLEIRGRGGSVFP